MFTGIIEALGEIKKVSRDRQNRVFFIKSSISSQLKIKESLNHNGICLTVEDIQKDIYRVTAINETLEKTNAAAWRENDFINLERAMKINDRLDGHIVQGHVDGTGICIKKKNKKGSVEFIFQYNKTFAPLIIEKGAICVNGASLTAFNLLNDTFTVAIIPYTFEHTNFQYLKKNNTVNLEFDILGKYISRIAKINSAN